LEASRHGQRRQEDHLDSRRPVSIVVRQIAHGATVDEILRGYPDLDKDDIQQAIEYAAWLSEEEVHAS
jgi:uncharacterized protein (DUF433 family)